MFLDDLIELDAIMRRISPKAKLEANGFELDTVEELKDVPTGKIRSMKWVASGPSFPSFLSLELSGSECKVVAYEYDDALRGAAEDAADALRRSRRRLGPLSWHWAIRSMLILLASAGVAFWSPEGWWLYPFAVAVPVVALGGLWVDWHHVVFVLHRRSERRSFWQRSADEVRLLFLGVILGAIPTGIIAYLTRN